LAQPNRALKGDKMPKRKLLRRFEPRYGVGASVVAEEANALGREVDDYEVQAANSIAEWLNERHTLCRQRWDELQVVLGHVTERDTRIIRCLLFRDFHHILELYLCHLRAKHPEVSAPTASVPITTESRDSKFNEWLFEL
jgi:hypothetical protein